MPDEQKSTAPKEPYVPTLPRSLRGSALYVTVGAYRGFGVERGELSCRLRLGWLSVGVMWHDLEAVIATGAHGCWTAAQLRRRLEQISGSMLARLFESAAKSEGLN